ncbi:high-affinity nickel-transport protein-domain-containing protein [Protomyces lactucae-debilis]|uniref:Nickel/cobalt efflux system n=1 Tax=Protomyces lactucae-debilis TaxID=2754530 RepID=A0A1Y2FIV9_PROLT|nr:high-affinity nickel-transport protein-domain-containing protein [Protomyces lactucae-debilis]ORY83863.1 high-affinity nickel-transport protein-domain-containing protein [Protomyces lactucae-debilis]
MLRTEALLSRIKHLSLLLKTTYLPFLPVLAAICFNLIIWIAAAFVFRKYTALLGPGTLAYTYGLRHALDADHISAIDNMTRRLVAEGQRPVSVGLWFSLGHSTVVLVTCIIVGASSAAIADRFGGFEEVGGIIGVSVSMAFLLLIGLANLFVLVRLIKSMRRQLAQRRRRLAGQETEDVEEKPHVHHGPLFRLCGRLFKLVDRPWKMYPLGVLFGLGFDTSTEVALLAIASIQATRGTPIYVILVFPFLFMAGMLLVDTIDGACMVWAYDSTLFAGNKIARLYYAILLTLMSVLVALTIGMLQLLTLIKETRHLHGAVWDGVGRAGDRFDVIGGGIVGAG